ncbi:unnamed protein product [Diatraea saccharalis]|uniref:Uncharacterized protein n=1 Tax=Diatraea saccharalis TaxID=40085 RepID=A0A9N9REF6_9NEOP|nr:unnamed protein product [Diatraea saccharalis]
MTFSILMQYPCKTQPQIYVSVIAIAKRRRKNEWKTRKSSAQPLGMGGARQRGAGWGHEGGGGARGLTRQCDAGRRAGRTRYARPLAYYVPPRPPASLHGGRRSDVPASALLGTGGYNILTTTHM